MTSNSDHTPKGNINYYYYLVAFIDILGQKEAFQGLEGQSLEDNHPRLIEAHKQTAMFVETLRNGFKDFFDAYTEEREPSVKVAPEKMNQFKAMLKSNLKHQRFSDCIQAYVCLHTDKYHSNAVNGVFGALLACGGMLVLSLAMKKAFRAGIEVGLGIELDNGEIYGPALYKAYALENKVAEYPRIVIGQELLNYLATLANKHPQLPTQTNEDVELCKVMATSCLKMIVRDLDGVPILDYLGKDFLKSINENSEQAKKFEEVLNQAFQFVELEYKKRKQAGDKKLALRYYLLLNYFKAKTSFLKGNNDPKKQT
ncbi:MAG: hypothetical protein ISS45_04730 [Candidatus Omnitrophica bacterium]|nr:hypothetical protein [Candidatus Omnitrophota bacterium]